MKRIGLITAALVASIGCEGSPTAPSIPLLAGIYSVSLSHCDFAGGQAAVTPQGGAKTWTLTQVGDQVVAELVGQVPPFNWKGSLTATVEMDGTVKVNSLTYQDSTSHSYIQILTTTGKGAIDATGFTGTLDGEYRMAETFGGAAAPWKVCQGAQMPFRFTRQ